jgi:hypothetical protein
VPLANAGRSRVVGAVTGDGTVPRVFVGAQRIGGLKPSALGTQGGMTVRETST